MIRWYFSDKNRLAEVEALVVEQNVVDWVLQKGQVDRQGADLRRTDGRQLNRVTDSQPIINRIEEPT